jgi:Ca2+-binding EF-hand superfamily protein
LKSLRSALQYDQPLPTVYYEKLFEETRDGDQGKFAETLRDQHLYDVMSTYPSIEDAIRRAVHIAKGGADAVLAHGKKFNAATDDTVSVETNVGVVLKGLSEYDSGLPNAVINKILATGLGLPLSEAPFSDYRSVLVEDFVQRLRTIIIPRYSKPRAETEAEVEEKFLRSLPESERKAIENCFNEMDTDFSGTLNAEELHEMLKRTYGMDPSPDELAQIIAMCDKGGDGESQISTYSTHSTTRNLATLVLRFSTFLLCRGYMAAIHSNIDCSCVRMVTSHSCLAWMCFCSAGLIGLEEFIVAMATSEQLKMAGEIFKWRSTFDRFDADGSGFVDGDELMDMVKELVGDVEAGSEDIANVMKILDESSDGEVSWEEFLAVMQKMSAESQ